MKVRVNKNEMIKGVQACYKAYLKQTPSQMFQACGITLSGEKLELISLNNEIAVNAIADCEAVESEDDKQYVLETALLLAALRKLPGEDLVMDFANGKAVIRSGKARVTLALLPDIVLSSRNNDPVLSSINVDILQDLKETKHALAKVASTPKMEAFYLEVSEDGYQVTALNGYVISRRKNGSEPFKYSFILKGKALLDALNAVEGEDGVDLVIPDNPKYIRISGEKASVDIATMDGTYFNISQYFGMFGNEDPVEVDKNELLAALNMMSLFGKAVKVGFTKDGLVIRSWQSDMGDSEITVAAEVKNEFTTGFNLVYITEALGAIPADKVFIYMPNNTMPALITDGDASQVAEIVVPLRPDSIQ